MTHSYDEILGMINQADNLEFIDVELNYEDYENLINMAINDTVHNKTRLFCGLFNMISSQMGLCVESKKLFSLFPESTWLDLCGLFMRLSNVSKYGAITEVNPRFSRETMGNFIFEKLKMYLSPKVLVNNINYRNYPLVIDLLNYFEDEITVETLGKVPVSSHMEYCLISRDFSTVDEGQFKLFKTRYVDYPERAFRTKSFKMLSEKFGEEYVPTMA